MTEVCPAIKKMAVYYLCNGNIIIFNCTNSNSSMTNINSHTPIVYSGKNIM